jgi:tripartite-type tricarboxylate transporter receptor subunit TctC
MRSFGLPILAACALGTGVGARADGVEDFYRGRSMTLIVSSGVGGGYDTYGRMLARHITRHIPGQPHIVVQNMPGAGSITALNYLFNVAPKDGSVISDADSTMPLYALLGGQNAKFDPLRIRWIGSTAQQISLCVAWAGGAFKTLEDATQRPMKVSATGIATLRGIVPRLFNEVAGTRFEVVTGYSTSEVFLAVERGEVDGTCFTYDTLLAAKYDWVQEKRVTILAQFGEHPAPGIESVPLARDRIKDPADRAAFDLILSAELTGRPYLAPPEIPPERLAALRRAFDESMTDPAFLADCRKARLFVDPASGAEIEALIARAYASSPATVARAKLLLQHAMGNP